MKYPKNILKTVLMCAALLGSTQAVAQVQATDTLIIAIKNPQKFVIDALNNIYIIDAQNELTKWVQNVQTANFRNAVWGRPSIDATNPTEIVVFYADASLMAILDQRLNILSTVRLQDVFDNEAAVLCRSFDNNYWLYHETAFRLKKISGAAQIIIDGERIPNIIQQHKPLQIVEYQTQVFVLFEGLGILVFDVFGNYIKKIDVPPITHFSIYKNEIGYISGNNVWVYNLTNATQYVQKPTPTHKLPVLAQQRTDKGSFVLTTQGVAQP
jgi:flagellar biosynthesis/type III secretory pathway chaperone